MNKYHNKKIVIDGMKFDSKKEYRRYYELTLMQKAGIIKNLKCQVPFELVPKQGEERAVKYIADFTYEENGKLIIEDTKGVKTKEYVIKRKLMLYIHGIKIREV